MNEAEVLSTLTSLGITSLLTIALCVAVLIGEWKLFVKAGEAGWKVLIPFYNMYILFKFVWGNGWYCVLSYIPGVNFVVSIIHSLKVAKVFGKSIGFAIGLILLPFVFIPILGFDKSQYLGLTK